MSKPKSKKRRGVKTKNQDLAIRKDVVNKTILRCLRRFMTSRYREVADEFFKTNNHKSKWYFQSIEKFVDLEFSEYSSERKKLQYYLGSIIYPKFVNKNHLRAAEMDEEEGQILYECMYKYSHTRLLKIIEFKPIHIIYKYFLKNALEKILDTEPAIIKNKETYEKCFQDFLAAFEDQLDPMELVTN